MKGARGPQIVDHQDEQEDGGEQRRHNRVSVDHEEGPTADGGDHQSNRGDEDEALVRWWIGAGAEGKKAEGGKTSISMMAVI